MMSPRREGATAFGAVALIISPFLFLMHSPASAETSTDSVSCQTEVSDIVCSTPDEGVILTVPIPTIEIPGAEVEVPGPSIEVPGATVTIPVPGPTIKVPGPTIKAPGPTIKVPGPTIRVPGPTVTVTPPVETVTLPPVVIPGPTETVTVRPDNKRPVQGPTAPPRGSPTLGPAVPSAVAGQEPTVGGIVAPTPKAGQGASETQGKTETIVKRVALGLLVTLALAALGVLALWVGYILGYKGAERNEERSLRNLLDLSKSSGNRNQQ